MKIDKVHLAGRPIDSLWDVDLEDDVVLSVAPAGLAKPEARHALLLLALCHPHIHLGKAFLLTSNDSRYADLIPTEGTFEEALKNTSAAKSRYDATDLELRGSQLIAESVQAGVTSMRAFVEVDHVVGAKCIEAALKLRKNSAGIARFRSVPLLRTLSFRHLTATRTGCCSKGF
jgi:cytosine/adenosine deaminase-related metal-dependent hydrolase